MMLAIGSPLRSVESPSRALSLGSARPALISLLSFSTISAGSLSGEKRTLSTSDDEQQTDHPSAEPV